MIVRCGNLFDGAFCQGWTVRDEAHAEGDESDSCPAFERDGFMEPETGEESYDHVPECCSGKDEGKIGPGESGKVAGEEADEQSDAERDPAGEDGSDKRAGVGQGDGGKQRHAALEAGIAERGADHDGEEHQVLIGFEAMAHRD